MSGNVPLTLVETKDFLERLNIELDGISMMNTNINRQNLHWVTSFEKIVFRFHPANVMPKNTVDVYIYISLIHETCSILS
jgi:hypothetical protein